MTESSEESEILSIEKELTFILDNVTRSNFKELMIRVLTLRINTEKKLRLTVDLMFEKAINNGPNLSEIYANMCRQMTQICVTPEVTPDQPNPSSQVEFRKLLLTKCQREFERDKSDLHELKKKMEENTDLELAPLLKAGYGTAELQHRQRVLGNIAFIGQLFKLRMLTEPIMHSCIMTLFKAKDDDHLELLSVLLCIIGKDLDTRKAKQRINQYFEQINRIIAEKRTSSRNNWVPRAIQTQGPKTITQIHQDAKNEQEMLQLKLATTPTLPVKHNNCGPPSTQTQRPHPTITYIHRDTKREKMQQKVVTVSSPPVKHISHIDQIEGWMRKWLYYHGDHLKADSHDLGSEEDVSKTNSEQFKGLCAKIKEILDALSEPCIKRLAKKVVGLKVTSMQNVSTIIGLIFDKVVEVPLLSKCLAQLCLYITVLSTSADMTAEPSTWSAFRELLVQKCQEQIELYGENKMVPMAEAASSLRMKNATQIIFFVGELFIFCVVPENLIHKCINILHNNEGNSDECLVRLLGIVSEDLEHPETKALCSEILGKNDQVARTSSMDRTPDSGPRSNTPTSMMNRFSALQGPGSEHDYQRRRGGRQGSREGSRSGSRGSMGPPSSNSSMRTPRRDERTSLLETTRKLTSADRSHDTRPRRSRDLKGPCGQNMMVPQRSNLSWSKILGKNEQAVRSFLENNQLEDLADCKGKSRQNENSAPAVWQNTSNDRYRLEKDITDLLNRELTNDQIFYWVEKTLSPEAAIDPTFIRALTISVCKRSLGKDPKDADLLAVDEEKISERSILLKKYIDTRPERELQVLYALQNLMVDLDQPRNILRKFFDIFYNEDVVQEQTFFKWEKPDIPNEEEGFGIAVASVNMFFTWLRTAEPESD